MCFAWEEFCLTQGGVFCTWEEEQEGEEGGGGGEGGGGQEGGGGEQEEKEAGASTFLATEGGVGPEYWIQFSTCFAFSFKLLQNQRYRFQAD